MSRLHVDGDAVDRFVWGEGGHGGDAEILVGCAAQVAYLMVDAGGYDVPVDEVARAVEDCVDVATLEVATLEECVYGLECVAVAELQWACDE